MPDINAPAPQVTAIIPVYNGESYLHQAIDSALAQQDDSGDFRLEVLLIDDGSTDSSALIARSYGGRIHYHYQPNSGLSAAQNSGVTQARGDFIAFLDCDDLWVPGKISRQMGVFRESPETDMVFGRVEQFYSPELDHASRREPPAVMAGYSTGTMLARTAVFDRVGSFSSDFRVGEFLDWYARATDAGLRSVMLDELVLKRRIHDDNMGLRDRDKRSDYLRVFKASLDRRRRDES